MRISVAVAAQAAPAMSAGEGLDEAAKDAADIAAFFKSGKSERGESGSGRAPVMLLVGSVVAVSQCCQKGQKKKTLSAFIGARRVWRFGRTRSDAHDL